MISLFSIGEQWPVWAVLWDVFIPQFAYSTLLYTTIKNTLGKLTLQVVICFFPPIDCTPQLGREKKSVVWQPESQSCFLPAKINGYRRRENEGRGGRRRPPCGLLYLQASFPLVWWSSTDKSFLTEAKLRGSIIRGAMAENIFTKNRLQPKLLFSTLFQRSWRPIDPFVSCLCWSGSDLLSLPPVVVSSYSSRRKLLLLKQMHF